MHLTKGGLVSVNKSPPPNKLVIPRCLSVRLYYFYCFNLQHGMWKAAILRMTPELSKIIYHLYH